MAKRPKLIAIYHPQFHAIPENDAWWGKGFTDWDKVKTAYPLFPGHRQPRVPLQGRYYDLSQPEAIAWQVALAKRHGVDGFAIYHFWFDGKQLLERPKELYLQHREWDLPFCLTWANEAWARRWEGGHDVILQPQPHEPTLEKWEQHFQYLLPFWRDPRAICVDGKPVFCIYRPHLIPKLPEMLSYWRKRAAEEGLPGLHLVATKAFALKSRHLLEGFDAVQLFQPGETINSRRWNGTLRFAANAALHKLPEGLLEKLRAVHTKAATGPRVFDYEKVCAAIVDNREAYPLPTYDMAFLEWDNTARYHEKSTLFVGCNPETFEKWLERIWVHSADRGAELLFLNAWNEWAEGAYLEPDTDYGTAYLEAVLRVGQRLFPREAARP